MTPRRHDIDVSGAKYLVRLGSGAAIPGVWTDDRNDVIRTPTLEPVAERYLFGQVPQQLLDGDTDTVT